MSSSPPAQATETLEVPAIPSSRFVLPPPPSDLMNRLQAFLPQMKEANEQLAEQPPIEDGDEGVVLQIVDSDDESSSSGSSSSSSDEEEDSEDEQGGGNAAGEQGEGAEGETMARLLDISARPKVVKKLVVDQEGSAPGEQAEKSAGGGAGIVEME